MIPQPVGTWEPKELDVAFPHCLHSDGPPRKQREEGVSFPYRPEAWSRDRRQTAVLVTARCKVKCHKLTNSEPRLSACF